MKYVIAPGFARNPLRRHRNIPCPCGSGKKAKRCHGAEEFVETKMADRIRQYLRELSAGGFITVRPGEIE